MNKYRTELKFLCTEKQLFSMENRIALLCPRDEHADAEGKYMIRSMYFDSADDECYRACKSGEDDRKKYRIRIYNGSKDQISLECKSGLHGKKKKETVLLTYDEFESLRDQMITGNGDRSKVLLDFETGINSGYRPAIVVEYVRTAYVFPAGNVRITFDRDITASPTESFFDTYSAGIPVLPKGISILEVKYDDHLPKAVSSLIKDANLRACSYSKYAICRDAFMGDLQYMIRRTDIF